jgi:hypothetical protein
VIAVVGLPAYVGLASGEGGVGGPAVQVAAAAAALGRATELIGKIGDDGAGDAVVLALGRLGIGHAALLRDPVRPTPVLSIMVPADDSEDSETEWEPVGDSPEMSLLPADSNARPVLEAGDISLALRYLTEARVVVLAEPLSDEAVAAAVEGSAFAGARLIVLLPPGATPPPLPPEATVLEAPAVDDGSFGRLVGAFAADLDAGSEPAAAFEVAVRTVGWEPVAD